MKWLFIIPLYAVLSCYIAAKYHTIRKFLNKIVRKGYNGGNDNPFGEILMFAVRAIVCFIILLILTIIF